VMATRFTKIRMAASKHQARLAAAPRGRTPRPQPYGGGMGKRQRVEGATPRGAR
jgi:hypothetical protein